jgi:hypothetical protein
MTHTLKRIALTASALAFTVMAQPAQARLIDTLPGGTQLSFAGDFESKRLDDGRFTRDYDGFTFAAEPAPATTNHFVSTSRPSADFLGNGQWTGPLMVLQGGGARGLFEFVFDMKQASVLFDMNWIPGLNGIADFDLSIFDSSNRLLETATISYAGNTGFFGFGERQSADIAKLTITGSEFGVRNMTVSDAVTAVPEPYTWATMVLGFLCVGGAMRSSRAQPRLSI